MTHLKHFKTEKYQDEFELWCSSRETHEIVGRAILSLSECLEEAEYIWVNGFSLDNTANRDIIFDKINKLAADEGLEDGDEVCWGCETFTINNLQDK